MFFSSPLLVVFKTTGGRAWNSSGSLKPLSGNQLRRRKSNVEQTLRNVSVIKMAAAREPEVPTRLFKPLNHWRLMWMRGKLDQSKATLGGWGVGGGGGGGAATKLLQAKLRAISGALQRLRDEGRS